MRGLRVDDHLGVLAVPCELGLQPLDGVERDERVVLTEKGEERGLELRRLLDRDAAPVERRGRLDLVGQLAGDEKAHPAAHAEPGDADPVAAHEGLALEVPDRAADVGHHLVVLEALHQGDRLGELVIADGPSLAAPPVEVRREGHVAFRGEATRDVLDVRVEAERLHDDEHRRGRAFAGRSREEGGERTGGRRNLDHLHAAPYREPAATFSMEVRRKTVLRRRRVRVRRRASVYNRKDFAVLD